MMRIPAVLLVSCWCFSASTAFLSSPTTHSPSAVPKHALAALRSHGEKSGVSSRREFWNTVTAASSVAFLGFAPLPSHAKTKSQLDIDKQNIVKGYERLTYLLDNWEEETSDCKRRSEFTGCERTPEKVMEYIGYKSMDDPLFRADKTLARLRDVVSDKDAAEFEDAFERYVENSEAANGIAFVSSWGEANPGGGKDRVTVFIERSRKNCEACQQSLGQVMAMLKLEDLIFEV